MRTYDFAVEIFSEYPPETFAYDPEDKQFTVGEDTVALTALTLRRPLREDTLSKAAAAELIDTSDILLHHGGLLMMPKLYNALRNLSSKSAQNVADNVADTLIDAYAGLTGTSRKRLLKGSHWGFGMGYLRPGHPDMTVLGDCACCGIGQYGTFDASTHAEGFGEFALHNIDRREQAVALAAGVGSLAYWVDKVNNPQA